MIKALFKTMRPRQWIKNVFVIAALVFDRQLPSPKALFTDFSISAVTPFLHSLAGFLLFCLLSSCVYIINDIFDVESDRNHPTKKNRPIASGKLPVPVALVTALVIIIICLPMSYWLSAGFFKISLAYFLVNLAYSNWLKHFPIIDVLILASFYVLRVAAGVSLIQVERFSPWLYVVTTVFALYLGFGKRRAELVLLANKAEFRRRVLDGYTIPFLDQLITIVSGTTLIAYCLYTFSAPNLPENHSMMLTIPFVIYAIFRYLYLIQVKQEGGAPDELAFADRPLQISFLLWGISVLVVLYLF